MTANAETGTGEAPSHSAFGPVSDKSVVSVWRKLFPFLGPAEKPSPEAERWRLIALLRTRVVREMRERGWTRLGILPLTPGAGGTTVALELTHVILRQPGVKVSLIDLNFSRPDIAQQLQIPGCGSISQVLFSGGEIADLAVCLPDFPDLLVLAPAAPEALAAELLQSPQLAAGLEQIQKNQSSDYAIFDLAPLSESDIGLSALPLVDAVLVVADGSLGRVGDMKLAQRYLADDIPLLGVVLNKAEK